MFELVLGVLLAALFVTAYLLITKLFRQEGRELGAQPTPVALHPVETARTIGTRQTPRALTTGEMSQHHSSGGGKDSGT